MNTFQKLINFSLYSAILIAAANTENNSLQQIPSHASHRLGSIEVLHDGNDFLVHKKNKTIKVPRYYLDSTLRRLNTNQLNAFKEHGYVSVNKIGKKEYSLRSHVRGEGGGPTTAFCAYWGTKIVGWGAVAVATLTVDPELPVHIIELNAAIEAAAQAAATAGMLAPTP